MRCSPSAFGSAAGSTVTVNGFQLHTQLDEATLQQISQVTDGTYYNATDAQQLRSIYDNLDTGLVLQPQMTEVVDTALPFKEAKERWNDHFERRYVAMVFTTNANNVTRAAEHAGLSRRHFRELLYKHGIVERPVEDSDAD